jgi:hypothetical protein
MASRKRPRRNLGSLRRKRWSILPLLENLENRLVLSQGIPPLPLMTPNFLAGSGAASWLPPENGLVTIPLANGGTAQMLKPGASGPLTPGSPVSSNGASPTTLGPNRIASGVILGARPVASPLGADGSLQTPGPAGYVPQQIQTAYGLSTGSGYNNISFAGIKGDGTHQTIGIFEEGYNPAFVPTSGYGNYSTSAWPSSTRPSACPTRPA